MDSEAPCQNSDRHSIGVVTADYACFARICMFIFQKFVSKRINWMRWVLILNLDAADADSKLDMWLFAAPQIPVALLEDRYVSVSFGSRRKHHRSSSLWILLACRWILSVMLTICIRRSSSVSEWRQTLVSTTTYVNIRSGNYVDYSIYLRITAPLNIHKEYHISANYIHLGTVWFYLLKWSVNDQIMIKRTHQ
jgi:hypothetical protein